MIEILTRNPCGCIVAYSKPDLSPAPGIQIVGRSRTSHLGWHPPRFECISPSFSTRGVSAPGRGSKWTSCLKGLHYKGDVSVLV